MTFGLKRDVHVQRALQQEGAERTRLEKEAAEERARAAGMQQQLVQAQEVASKLKEAIAEEHARLNAQAEQE